MAEAAGLALGVVATWKTCVEVFDVVDGGRKYGMDYEVLRVKLEVERIRLLMWGNVVGLGEMGGSVPPKPDSWVHRQELRGTVVRVLGCIHQVFENTDRLEDRYGLRPATPLPETWDGGGGPSTTTQSQLILGTVFKRAYEVLRKSAAMRQRETPLRRKTLWAVHDRNKFQSMVTEIKGFNDNLESLFPELRAQTAHQMRNDIEDSDDIRALQSLQEAAQAEHEQISDCASIRLEALGATTTARSRVSDAHTVAGDETAAAPGLDNMAGLAEALDEEPGDDDSEATAEYARAEGIPQELAREMRAVETFTSDKNKGCLTLSVLGPHSYTTKVTAHTYWDGVTEDRHFPYLNDRLKGFVKTSNASFGMYFPRAAGLLFVST